MAKSFIYDWALVEVRSGLRECAWEHLPLLVRIRVHCFGFSEERPDSPGRRDGAVFLL